MASNTGNGDASYFLGALLVNQGKYADAIPYLEAANQRAESWATLYYLGKAKLKLRLPSESAAYLERSAQLNPDQAPVYYLLSQALRELGRTKESERALQHVRSLRASGLTTEQSELFKQLPGTR